MDSLPVYEVFPQRDKSGMPTGRWCWEVYDEVSGGPIDGGIECDKQTANAVGKSNRMMAELRFYQEA
jgi:hypothetical protein